MASAGEKSLAVGHIPGFQIDPIKSATIYPFQIQDAHTELQLKSLEKILIARRAWSSYETCFVISFLINHKTGSAIRRCLPD